MAAASGRSSAPPLALRSQSTRETCGGVPSQPPSRRLVEGGQDSGDVGFTYGEHTRSMSAAEPTGQAGSGGVRIWTGRRRPARLAAWRLSARIARQHFLPIAAPRDASRQVGRWAGVRRRRESSLPLLPIRFRVCPGTRPPCGGRWRQRPEPPLALSWAVGGKVACGRGHGRERVGRGPRD
jgi:hypothetical protein